MRNLFITLSIILLLSTGASIMSCYNSTPKDTTTPKILKLKIIDKTLLHYYMTGNANDEIVITDADQIADFQKQFQAIKEVQNVGIKSNFGFFEVFMSFSNNTTKDLGVIYTRYDGVIIYDYTTNKEYKNNDFEVLIRPYFNPKSH